MRRPKKDGRGTLKIALQHKHMMGYKTLDVNLLPEEWEASKNQITNRPDKKFLNVEIRTTYLRMAANLERVMRRADYEKLTAKDIMDMISRGATTVDEPSDLDYLLPVYNEYITLCRSTNTATSYKTSLNNLIEYCEGEIDTLTFRQINAGWLRKYQQWLTDDRGMGVNGANVYMRNLRTIFNYAINNEFTSAHYPFKEIDMSTIEPDKRTIPYEKFIEWATLPMSDQRNFYRDLFLLSFYLCGIRPVDLLHVKKSQVQDGRLVYYPKKLNGRTKLSIKIEPEAWEIIHRYEGKELLLNIMETRSDYQTFAKHWNAAIRAIGEDIREDRVGRKGKEYTKVTHKSLIPYMTVYYSRRCFATYLYNVLDTPMDVISQALGHSSGLRVTNLYVKRDMHKVDVANRNMIDRLKADMAQAVQARASA